MIEVNINCGCIIVKGEKATSLTRLEQFLNTTAKPIFEGYGFTASVIDLTEINEETPLVDESSYHSHNLWLDVLANSVSEGEHKVANAIASSEFYQLAKDKNIEIDWYQFGDSRVMKG